MKLHGCLNWFYYEENKKYYNIDMFTREKYFECKQKKLNIIFKIAKNKLSYLYQS